MYHELLMEHYKFPHFKKELVNPTLTHADLNVSCGDRVTYYLIIECDTIADISFMGSGCVISQASADILAGHVRGMPIEEVKKITAEVLLQKMDIQLGPNRLKCALLALQILQDALGQYTQKN